MARVQEQGPVEAGSVNPQVLQMMQGEKQSADNRLAQAMQATQQGQQQRSAQRQQTRQQGVQIGADAVKQTNQLAAQKEMQVDRMAQMERLSREDKAHDTAMEQSRQKYQSEEAAAHRTYLQGLHDDTYEQTEKNNKQVISAMEMSEILAAKRGQDLTNASLTSHKLAGLEAVSREKFITHMTKVNQEHGELGEKMSDLGDSTYRALQRDPRMQYVSPEGVQRREETFGKDISFLARAFSKARGLDIEKVRGIEKTDPMAVLQEQVKGNGSPVSLEDLSAENISNFVKKVQDGEIQPNDISVALVTLQASERAFMEKIEESKSKDSKDAKYWRGQLATVRDMQFNIRQKQSDTTKIGENQTVGGIVHDGVGWNKGMNEDIRQRLKSQGLEESGYNAVYESYVESMKNPSLMVAPPNASPELLEKIERHNSVYATEPESFMEDLD